MFAKNVTVMVVCALIAPTAQAHAPGELSAEVDRRAARVQPQVVAWRRTIHQNPELSNREVNTAKLIASELTRLGFEVHTGVAHTGVVGILRGGRPGPVVALRADMDALPIAVKDGGEQTGLPFASKVFTEYNGQKVNVVHACGHDAHVAIALGVATVLAELKDSISGTVKFIAQPAEEGAPQGEQGGSRLMIEQGVLENPAPGAIFGLHVWPYASGTIYYRPGQAMAMSDRLKITITGRQTHASTPWNGVDAILIASRIVTDLQDIVARQVNVVQSPAVITIGTMHGGVRSNVLAPSVELEGTIRSFDEPTRVTVHKAIERTATHIAAAGGGKALVEITRNNPGVYNHPELTTQVLGSLRRIVGDENLRLAPPVTGSEDFGDYQRRVPGLFVFLGVTAKGLDPAKVPHNHAPDFMVDEGALELGVRALANLALDWLSAQPKHSN